MHHGHRCEYGVSILIVSFFALNDVVWRILLLKKTMGAPKKIISNPFLAWLWLGSALAVLLTLIAVNLYRSHGRIAEREQERLSAQAGVIAENIESQLLAVHSALGQIAADVRDDRKTLLAQDVVGSYFSALVTAWPGVRSIAIVDAHGAMVASNHRELLGRNFNDLGILSQIRDHPDPDTLYVSSALTSSSHPNDINIGRLIPDGEGGFAGIVFVVLDLPYFNTLVRSVLYAPDMWGALTYTDGQLAVTALAMVGNGPINQPSGMVAQRTVRPPTLKIDKPLEIVLGREQDQIFLQWR